MSEYQYIAFRAIDAPVSKENLAYMRRQSTRAEITPWRFDNEYHWGDFRGNAFEMLRRGYDFHLHYANYGVRALFIRLPNGFPNPKAARPYLGKSEIRYNKDSEGPGGTIVVNPYLEPGELDDLWDVEGLIDRLLPLRDEMLSGDLRPLYLAHLAMARDNQHDPDDATEGPVPAGLDQLTKAQQALAKFYGMRKALLAAAAEECPPLPPPDDCRPQYAQWLAAQSVDDKDRWLAELMKGTHAAVRAKLLAEYRGSQCVPPWPTVRRDRAISQLRDAAARRRRAAKAKAQERKEEKRKQQLVAIAADPQPFVRRTEELVAQRSTAAYEEVALLLAEIREALAETRQAGLAEQHAQKLRADHPTRRHLIAALRRRNFLPK